MMLINEIIEFRISLNNIINGSFISILIFLLHSLTDINNLSDLYDFRSYY
jgi:hypothetical protein